jgi:hypothetical protein
MFNFPTMSPPQGGRPPQLWDVNPALAVQK